MSKMQMSEDEYQVSTRHNSMQEYVKEFTRHSNDVLLNLNELRHRDILNDATLLVGSARLRAHCAVLTACSGLFYSLFSHHKTSAAGEQGVSVSLPEGLDAGSVALLLDFMYTSRLPLSPDTAPGVLAAATYLQMEHVADTCRVFLKNSKDLCPPEVELVSTNTGGRSPNHPSFSSLPSIPAVDTKEPSPAKARVSRENFLQVSSVSSSQRLKVEEAESSALSHSPPSPDSPSQCSGQPNSPVESSSCTFPPKPKQCSESRLLPDPKACNWKKYKYIILNPLCASSIKEEECGEDQQMFDHSPSTTNQTNISPKTTNKAWLVTGPQLKDNGQDLSRDCDSPRLKVDASFGGLLPQTADIYRESLATVSKDCRGMCSPYHHPYPSVLEASKQNAHPFGKLSVKLEHQSPVICYSGTQGNTKSTSSEKPYRCNVCGAQFNRPANLKTHSRIHSGEKPYRCDTCGARFVQVAHLRAHVLIHTGEKPYPCQTCGTRFRHLQTLKSHLRIHTGEKPYSCEKCDLHFRHKSQLRLHLRQKHGAITNTKIRYNVLANPYQTA
ncbi:B-cell CLL/lymphoma 6 member B protein-like [Trichomycterus rosablanca]|uniref:B-cell CLL/lymphoma 6 member B protein n=1 Tax=Trichomycterus rosablanca TaxID=2290929 RepID=UPI002F3575EB